MLNLLLSSRVMLQSDVTVSRIRLDCGLDCFLHACSRKSDKSCISSWLFHWNCLMALSLETAYSRAHSDGLELIGGPGHALIFQFNVDLECDLIELVGKTYVQEIYTTAAIWCTMFETQLGWNDFTNWKSNKRKWSKTKSQKYFQTFSFQC